MSPNFNAGSNICFASPDKPVAPGDIVLFEISNNPTGWFFRVIAVSGDNFSIDNGIIKRNNQEQKPEYNIIDDFLIETDKPLSPLFLKDGLKTIDSLSYQFTGSRHFLDNVLKSSGVSAEIRSQNQTLNGIAFLNLDKNSNASNIPVIHIPGKGETIALNFDNYLVYQLLLDPNQIDSIKKGSSIKMLLKEDLYFVMGDNRISSLDSRFIGLVPASKVHGVVYQN